VLFNKEMVIKEPSVGRSCLGSLTSSLFLSGINGWPEEEEDSGPPSELSTDCWEAMEVRDKRRDKEDERNCRL